MPVVMPKALAGEELQVERARHCVRTGTEHVHYVLWCPLHVDIDYRFLSELKAR